MSLADHLWQSTVCAAVAGLLTLALRQNRARVRHWLWFAASVKFLIPLSMLVALGSQIEWKTAPVRPSVAVAMGQVVEPFSVSVVSMPAPAENRMPDVLFAVWAAGALVISFTWLVRWRRIRSAVRNGSTIELDLPLRVICSPTTLEPGVFGIFRPVLLLPEGIFERLTPTQMKAILAHELCHVRHRDNLLAAIHMFVETVFWFHPLVWLIGKRMVAEREQACDEEVLRTLGEPQAYAEGILSVCKLYVESPLKCVSGVTGADLKKRIEAIMRNHVGLRLSIGKKAAIAVAGTMTATLPLIVGMWNAPAIQAQSTANKPRFEVASIRPCNGGSGAPKGASNSPEPRSNVSPGRLNLGCMTVANLIRRSYLSSWSTQLMPTLSPMTGGPAWTDSERYSISAKAPDGTGVEVMQGPMMQALLEDRFGLKLRREAREGPIYALTTSRSGSKLQRFQELCTIAPARVSVPPAEQTPNEKRPCLGELGRNGLNYVIRVEGATFTHFAQYLAAVFNRPVIDRTGITGRFDFYVEYAPDATTPGLSGGTIVAPENPSGVSIFTALDEQLGLKVELAKGPIEFLVIDDVDRPSEN